MPESTPSPEAVPSSPLRRRRRRLGRILGGLALVAAGAGAAVWIWRVPLTNHLLLSEESVWRVRVEGIYLTGSGVRLEGLTVRHVDQAEPVFSAAVIDSTSGWEALRAGNLGKVAVRSPAVHWRGGLRKDPPSPSRAPASVPLVTWEALTLTGGTVDLASAGSFVLTSGASGQGGGGGWYEDGRLELAGQELVLTDPVYRMEFEEGPVSRVEVEAAGLEVDGALPAADGVLAFSRAAFAPGAKVRFFSRPAEAAKDPKTDQGAPGKALPEPKEEETSGGRGMVTGVRLAGLRAAELQAEAELPWKLSGKTTLVLDSLQAGKGLPFEMSGLRLEDSSARLPGGVALPKFMLAARWADGVPVVERLDFEGAEVPDGAALLRLLGLPAPEGPDGPGPGPGRKISFKAGGRLDSLRLGADGGLASGAVQSLEMREARIEIPGQMTADIPRLKVEAVPDEILRFRRLRLLELDAPRIDLRLDQTAVAASSPEAGVKAPPESSGRPGWEGWHADRVKVSDAALEVTLPATAGHARIATGLAVSTENAGRDESPAGSGQPAGLEGGPEPSWQVSLEQPRLIQPDFPDHPIALAEVIRLQTTPAGLWQRREVESLTVSGARLQIGEGLFRLVNAMPPPPPEPPDALPGGPVDPPRLFSPPWRMKKIVLEDSLVRIDNIGGSRRLDIPVSRQEFHDLPLDADALAAVNRVYKVEVPKITLYNPWGEGQKVAELDTNYIQFTPAGLLERRLERVDLMLPSIYAGKPLHEFVEAARQRFTEMADVPPQVPLPLLVDTNPLSRATLSALAVVSPSEVAEAADWHIPFYTESGKVYVAPKGYPWPNIPVIPFRNARDAAGKPVPFLLKGESFHGELAIEPGWYDFPEYKVRLKLSNRGRIVFNTPQKDRDNNLTEVFENNTLLFRQLRIDEAWLSVTYDASGIYARFGGRTCGGMLSGGVNLYMDELYTWDGWASLTGISMKEFTDKLTPDTFRMTGPVDEVTVKAYGDTTTLYQAVLDLKVSKPGKLHLLALDGLKDRIDAMGGLSADFGQIGLATLRDFAYTGCEGGLKFFGTEGNGQLSLTGPGGSRVFNLKLHDYRARLPKTAAPF